MGRANCCRRPRKALRLSPTQTADGLYVYSDRKKEKKKKKMNWLGEDRASPSLRTGTGSHPSYQSNVILVLAL